MTDKKIKEIRNHSDFGKRNIDVAISVLNIIFSCSHFSKKDIIIEIKDFCNNVLLENGYAYSQNKNSNPRKIKRNNK